MRSTRVPVRPLAATLGAGALLFSLAACGGSETDTQAAANTAAERVRQATAEQAGSAAPAQAAQPVAQAAAPVAAAGSGCEVPGGELRGKADAGKQVYGMYCVTCHGPSGKGDGPAAPPSPKPADHTDPGRMGKLSDQEIYKVIKCGGASVGKSPLMTPWGPVLNDQQIRDTLAYVRTLSKT
jgi:mono/diheme cytochrome c family protein